MAGAWEGEPSLEGVVTSKSRRHRSEGRWLGRRKSRGVQFRQSRWFSELRLWLALGKASRRRRESLPPNPAGTSLRKDLPTRIPLQTWNKGMTGNSGCPSGRTLRIQSPLQPRSDPAGQQHPPPHLKAAGEAP